MTTPQSMVITHSEANLVPRKNTEFWRHFNAAAGETKEDVTIEEWTQYLDQNPSPKPSESAQRTFFQLFFMKPTDAERLFREKNDIPKIQSCPKHKSGHSNLFFCLYEDVLYNPDESGELVKTVFMKRIDPDKFYLSPVSVAQAINNISPKDIARAVGLLDLDPMNPAYLIILSDALANHSNLKSAQHYCEGKVGSEYPNCARNYFAGGSTFTAFDQNLELWRERIESLIPLAEKIKTAK